MKKFLFTVVAAALSIGAFAAEIKLNKKVIDRKSHKLYRYDISGFKYKQSFNYIVFSKKDGTETLANNSGNVCGLTYGWFGSGMISAVANNKVQLLAQPPKIEEGKDSIKFNFDGKGFKSELTFKFVPDSDLVIGKLKVEPAAALRKLVVNFFSVPGHNGNTIEGKKPFNRYFATALRRAKLENGKSVVIDKDKENWISLFDEYNDGTGSGVLLYAPDKVKSVKITAGGRLVVVNAELPAKQNEFDFVLRGIPTSYLDEDEVIEDMKKNAADMMR